MLISFRDSISKALHDKNCDYIHIHLSLNICFSLLLITFYNAMYKKEKKTLHLLEDLSSIANVPYLFKISKS